MRTFVTRFTWAGTALLGLGLLASAGCKSTPWGSSGSLAGWGKKDASLMASKPNPNFPASPSKGATPNPTGTAAVNSGARPGGNNMAGTPGGNGGSAYSQNPGGNSSYGGARPGAAPAGGGSGGSDHGFYSGIAPGSNGPSKFGANAGYAAGAGAPRGGLENETADSRNGFGRPTENSFAGGEYGAPPRPAADGAQRNPYASPAAYAPAANKGYGAPGHEGHDHGHDHGDGHDHGEYAPTDSYGSSSTYGPPKKAASSYDQGGSGGFAPPGSAYQGASAGGKPGGRAAPAGLSQRGSGYMPGSTRRSVGGPSESTDYGDDSAVKPAGYAKSGPAEDDSPASDFSAGGSFNESDELPDSPPARLGSLPSGGSYE